MLDHFAAGPPRRIADVGGGYGRLAGPLSARHDVTLVDVSPEMLEEARRRWPGLSLLEADARSLPFADGELDAVLALDLTPHLPDLEAGLRELARVVRPGGEVVVDTSNRSPWWVPAYPRYVDWRPKRLLLTMRSGGVLPEWRKLVRHHEPAEMRRALEAAGLRLRAAPVVRPAVVGQVASLVDRARVKRTLLLYLASAHDPQRFAVAPALAALAERTGWEFELHYDDLRAGRHFGGGPPEHARPGWAAGSLVAGGRHAEHVHALARGYAVIAVGDPASSLWPVLDAAGVEALVRSADPAELYAAAWEHASEPLPADVLVVDASPQGPDGVVAAPYLYPAFFAGVACLGLEASAAGPLEGRRHRGVLLAPGRAEWVDERLGEVGAATYAELTADLAQRHAAWGEGILIGDPELVAAQLPRARRRRLVPLYGRPQVDVHRPGRVARAAAAEPVWGRQYDDRDFLELARLGHGLQVLDPGPPFDAAAGAALPESTAAEPDDATLQRWASEGRILTTLVFWAGMVREAHCLAPIVDLVAATGLRAGIVLTVPALEAADPAVLALLGVEPERGGVAGLLEPLAGSTGYGVAAEELLPEGVLDRTLADARSGGLAVQGLVASPRHRARAVRRPACRAARPAAGDPLHPAWRTAPSRRGRDRPGACRASAGRARARRAGRPAAAARAPLRGAAAVRRPPPRRRRAARGGGRARRRLRVHVDEGEVRREPAGAQQR